MAAVRGGVEHHIVRPAFDPAFEHGLERLVGGVLAVEGKVVAEYDEAALAAPDEAQQHRQGRDVLTVDFDQGQRAGRSAQLAVHMGMDGFDDRALARTARAPEQGIVGRQALGEAPGIVEQSLLLPVDALQKVEIDPVDLGHRLEPVAGGMPDIGFGGVYVGAGRRRGRQSVQGFDDT